VLGLDDQLLVAYVAPDTQSWGQQTRAVAVCRQLERLGAVATIVAPVELEPLREHAHRWVRPLWQFPALFADLRPDVVVVDAQPWVTYGPGWSRAFKAFTGPKLFVRRTYEPEREGDLDGWISVMGFDAVLDAEEGMLVRDADELLPRTAVRWQLGVRSSEVAVLLASTPRADVAEPFRIWARAAAAGTGVRLICLRHFPLVEAFEAFDAAVTTGGMLAHEVRVSGLPHMLVPANAEQAARSGPRPTPEAVREWLTRVQVRVTPLRYVNPATQMARDILEVVGGRTVAPAV
jgi:hypothetical protein